LGAVIRSLVAPPVSTRAFRVGGLPYLSVMRLAYNKLVRDRIPELDSDGRRAVTHVLDEDSYRVALLAKLMEEVQEADRATPDKLAAELADVLEALKALVTTLGMTWEQLLTVTADKRTQRGGFEGRLYLEYVEQDGSTRRPTAGT